MARERPSKDSILATVVVNLCSHSGICVILITNCWFLWKDVVTLIMNITGITDKVFGLLIVMVVVMVMRSVLVKVYMIMIMMLCIYMFATIRRCWHDISTFNILNKNIIPGLHEILILLLEPFQFCNLQITPIFIELGIIQRTLTFLSIMKHTRIGIWPCMVVIIAGRVCCHIQSKCLLAETTAVNHRNICSQIAPMLLLSRSRPLNIYQVSDIARLPLLWYRFIYRRKSISCTVCVVWCFTVTI